MVMALPKRMAVRLRRSNSADVDATEVLPAVEGGSDASDLLVAVTQAQEARKGARQPIHRHSHEQGYQDPAPPWLAKAADGSRLKSCSCRAHASTLRETHGVRCWSPGPVAFTPYKGRCQSLATLASEHA